MLVIILPQKRSCMSFDVNSTQHQIHIRKIPALNADNEAKAFWESIKKRRGKCTVYTLLKDASVGEGVGKPDFSVSFYGGPFCGTVFVAYDLKQACFHHPFFQLKKY